MDTPVELLAGAVVILTNIGAAFYAAKKSAEQANKTSSETLHKVNLLDATFSIRFDNIDQKYNELRKQDEHVLDEVKEIRNDVQLMRNAMGTRRSD